MSACLPTVHWYGALFWADEGILLSTSVGLQALVDICQEHAKESDLYLLFSTDPNPNQALSLMKN